MGIVQTDEAEYETRESQTHVDLRHQECQTDEQAVSFCAMVKAAILLNHTALATLGCNLRKNVSSAQKVMEGLSLTC